MHQFEAIDGWVPETNNEALRNQDLFIDAAPYLHVTIPMLFVGFQDRISTNPPTRGL